MKSLPSLPAMSWTASLIGCLWLLSASRVSAAEAAINDTANLELSASWDTWKPAPLIDGFKPLFNLQERSVELNKRACSANGSNFCFGDSESFCATCGICCGAAATGYCCGADQLCCGNACCASGQTCSGGECFLPVETIVVTTGTQVTVSHTATQVVTVVQAVVQTSTIFSTTEITVSSGGTQTDIVYATVTVTANAKRYVVVEANTEPRDDHGPGFSSTIRHFYKRFSFPWTTITSRDDTTDLGARGDLDKRAEIPTHAPGQPISSSTVRTTLITVTSDVTSFIPTTTTVPTTSMVLTTIFQTKTRVLNAQATTTSTSTLTVTSRPPTTETITQTAAPTSATSTGPPSTSDTSTPAPASSGLSKGAIGGIAGGIGGAALLLLLIGLAVWWRRRRNRPPPHQDPSSYLEPYIPDMSAPLPAPTSPPNRFSASAPHHADAGVGAGLVAAGGRKPDDRYSGRKSVSPRLPDVAEVDGASRPVPADVYEADGASRTPHSPPYPVDAGEMEDSSPTAVQHQRQASGGGRYAGAEELDATASAGPQPGRFGHLQQPHAEELDASPTGHSPDVGTGRETLRNTNPYKQPGAYRDF